MLDICETMCYCRLTALISCEMMSMCRLRMRILRAGVFLGKPMPCMRFNLHDVFERVERIFG